MLNSSETHLAGVHDIVGVKLFLDVLEHMHRGTVELFHQPSELQADAVVIVQHAAVGQRRTDAAVPDLIVQAEGFLGVLGGIAARIARSQTRL